MSYNIGQKEINISYVMLWLFGQFFGQFNIEKYEVLKINEK